MKKSPELRVVTAGEAEDAHKLHEELRAGLDLEPEQEALFEDFCRCLARVRALEAVIDAEGVVICDDKAGRRKHPALQTLREYRQAAQRYQRLFGLDRARPAPAEETQEPLAPGEEFLDDNWTPRLPGRVN